MVQLSAVEESGVCEEALRCTGGIAFKCPCHAFRLCTVVNHLSSKVSMFISRAWILVWGAFLKGRTVVELRVMG